jgi:hypothetical protein
VWKGQEKLKLEVPKGNIEQNRSGGKTEENRRFKSEKVDET